MCGAQTGLRWEIKHTSVETVFHLTSQGPAVILAGTNIDPSNAYIK